MAVSLGAIIEYDTGSSNAVAMDNFGHVVEVHVGTGRLYYRVGTADFISRTITWGSSIEYDAGSSNAVALAKGDPNVIVEGQLVAVHVGAGHLYYRVGTADFTSRTITWGPGIEYDTGSSNAVTLWENGQLVEVHAGGGHLYYGIGVADFSNGTITWSVPRQEYDSGGPNAVAVNDFFELVEVHVGTDRLFFRWGRPQDRGGIPWAPSLHYGTGSSNAVAMSNLHEGPPNPGPAGVVMVHVTSGRLFYRVGNLV
jgi:hypothetical protein